MLDYRMHYAVMAAEDHLRPARRAAITPLRGPRRVFRIGPAVPRPRWSQRG